MHSNCKQSCRHRNRRICSSIHDSSRTQTSEAASDGTKPRLRKVSAKCLLMVCLCVSQLSDAKNEVSFQWFLSLMHDANGSSCPAHQSACGTWEVHDFHEWAVVQQQWMMVPAPWGNINTVAGPWSLVQYLILPCRIVATSKLIVSALSCIQW